eukprot:PhF_6_TR42990/c0_g1_i3/m.65572
MFLLRGSLIVLARLTSQVIERHQSVSCNRQTRLVTPLLHPVTPTRLLHLQVMVVLECRICLLHHHRSYFKKTVTVDNNETTTNKVSLSSSGIQQEVTFPQKQSKLIFFPFPFLSFFDISKCLQAEN